MPEPRDSDDPTDSQLRALVRLEQELDSASPELAGPGAEPAPSPLAEDEARARFVLQQLKQLGPGADPQPPVPDAVDAAGGVFPLPASIGKYQILELLGTGGFAVVYLGWDRGLRRKSAIKVPLPRRLGDRHLRRRFLREARAAGQLDHPHIVAIWETGEEREVPYIAYAYCDGPTLARHLHSGGPLSPRLAAQLTSQLADGVAYSHDRGILHRDIKPANVLLVPRPASAPGEFGYIPRLTDFGLAKVMERAVMESDSSVVIGTPMYLAPELLQPGGKSGFATDVFGLGTVLYESLTGRPPFEGNSVTEVLERARQGEVSFAPDLTRHIPADLLGICRRALARDPRDRYSTAAELRSELQNFLSGDPVVGMRLSWLRTPREFLEHPARIREAAAFTLISHGAILIWLIQGPFLLLPENRFSMEDVPTFLLPISSSHLAMMFVAWRMGRGELWAAWVSVLMPLAAGLFQLAALLGWSPIPFPSLYRDPQTMYVVFPLLILICIFQAALSGLAVRAISIRRSRLAAAQRPAGGDLPDVGDSAEAIPLPPPPDA